MGPRTLYLRILVPKTIPSMAFGTRVLKYGVLGPFGFSTGRIKGPKYLTNYKVFRVSILETVIMVLGRYLIVGYLDP